MSAFNPMSDIGRSLASREGEFTMKKINELLDVEAAKVDAKVRRGLDKDAFEKAKEHKTALASAKLILKSVHIFHQVR